MTAPTPEQMRALAAETEMYLPKPSAEVMQRNIVTLRVAAYQLEAVQAVLDRAESENAPHLYPADIEAALTADTAPQAETCWACARENTTDVPEGDIPLCTKHWNWWVMRWLNAADEPPCAAHLITAPQDDRDE